MTTRREPIHVMLVISNLEYGGAQRQVVELANNLDTREFEVHVCSLSPYVPLADALRNRSRLHIISKCFKFDASVVPRLARLLRRTRIDVVQSYLFDADIAACLAGRLARTPIVAGSERNANYALKKRQLAAYRLTRGCVDLLVANSRTGAEFNRRVVGFPPRIYRVVHNGVDTTRFHPDDGGALRRELGIRPGERVVGIFASFKEQKNHPLFFRAMARVVREFPDTKLLLVGDELYGGMHGSDEYKRGVMRLVEELELRERCIFTGNQDAVHRYYPVCDLTVMCSHFEGTPNAVLESLACGVPVITTNVSDAALLVPDGQVGFVVPPGDVDRLSAAIGTLVGDSGRRKAMARAAREWTEQQFSTRRLAEKTADVYREALTAAEGKTTAAARIADRTHAIR